MTSTMRPRQLLAAVLLTLSWVFLTAPEPIAATKVTPVRVQVDAKGRGVVTVTNVGDRDTLYKINALSWEQSDGKDVTTPTKEFIASPPSFTLKPGQTRDIRIGFRSSKRLAVERTYRLSIQEIPSKVQIEGSTLALSVAVRHLLPVFVAPANQSAEALPRWTGRHDGDSLIVRCENRGQRHFSFQRIALGKSAKTKGKPAFSTDLKATVLPGAWQEWRIKLPAELRGMPLSTIAVGRPQQKELTSYPINVK